MRLPALAFLAAAALLAPSAGEAKTLRADAVLDFRNSGVGVFGLFPDERLAYGGTFPGVAFVDFPKPVPFTHATDGNPGTFLSLARGSHIVLGFSGGIVKDGEGADIFISEAGDFGEEADVHVSEDEGESFTFLGKVRTGPKGILIDLADFGFTGLINAIKLVGLDSEGVAPGFDLAYVEGLNFVLREAPPPSPDVPIIPLPASLPLLLGGLATLGLLRRRHGTG